MAINVLFLGKKGDGKWSTIEAIANFVNHSPSNEAFRPFLKSVRAEGVRTSSQIRQGIESLDLQPNLESSKQSRQPVPLYKETVTYPYDESPEPFKYSFYYENQLINIIDMPEYQKWEDDDLNQQNFNELMIDAKGENELQAIVIFLKETKIVRKMIPLKVFIKKLCSQFGSSVRKNIFLCITFSSNPSETCSTLNSLLDNVIEELTHKFELGKNCFFIDKESSNNFNKGTNDTSTWEKLTAHAQTQTQLLCKQVFSQEPFFKRSQLWESVEKFHYSQINKGFFAELLPKAFDLNFRKQLETIFFFNDGTMEQLKNYFNIYPRTFENFSKSILKMDAKSSRKCLIRNEQPILTLFYFHQWLADFTEYINLHYANFNVSQHSNFYIALASCDETMYEPKYEQAAEIFLRHAITALQLCKESFSFKYSFNEMKKSILFLDMNLWGRPNNLIRQACTVQMIRKLFGELEQLNNVVLFDMRPPFDLHENDFLSLNLESNKKFNELKEEFNKINERMQKCSFKSMSSMPAYLEKLNSLALQMNVIKEKCLKQDIDNGYLRTNLLLALKVPTTANCHFIRLGEPETSLSKTEVQNVKTVIERFNLTDFLYTENNAGYLEILKDFRPFERSMFGDSCRTDSINNELEEFKTRMHHFIIRNCLCPIDKLKAIVIDTSGSSQLNTDEAFVADDQFTGNYIDLPYPMQSFLMHLEYFNAKLGIEIKDEDYYDYKAIYAKKNGFLFINTSLSERQKSVAFCNLTIQFINQILGKAKEIQLQITIIDMRSLEDEFDEKSNDFSSNSNENFEIDTHQNFHSIVILDDPICWDTDDENVIDDKIISKVENLVNNKIEIHTIYFREEMYTFAKQTANKTSQNINDNGDTEGTSGSGARKRFKRSNKETLDENFDDIDTRAPSKVESTGKVSPEPAEMIPKLETLRILLTEASQKKWKVKCEEINEESLQSILNGLPFIGNSTSPDYDACLIKREQNGQTVEFILLHYSSKEKKALHFNVHENLQIFDFEFMGIQIKYSKEKLCPIMHQIREVTRLIEIEPTIENAEFREILEDISAKTRPDIMATVRILKDYNDDLTENAKLQLISSLKNYLTVHRDYLLMLSPVEPLCGNADASDTSTGTDGNDQENGCTTNQNYENANESELELIERWQLGYYISLYRSSIAWSSIKHSYPNQGNAKLELEAKRKIAMKIKELRKLLQFIGIDCTNTITVYVDFVDHSKGDKSALHKMKLDDEKRVILKFQYISRSINISDAFTKPLRCQFIKNKNSQDRENARKINSLLGLIANVKM